jgi:hypothetical protein
MSTDPTAIAVGDGAVVSATIPLTIPFESGSPMNATQRGDPGVCGTAVWGGQLDDDEEQAQSATRRPKRITHLVRIPSPGPRQSHELIGSGTSYPKMDQVPAE